ncbi:MAG: hypothetical protein ACPL3A_03720 [Thermoanaerobacteraceae bacterium]
MLFIILLTAFVITAVSVVLLERNNQDYETYVKDELGYEDELNSNFNYEGLAINYKF